MDFASTNAEFILSGIFQNSADVCIKKLKCEISSNSSNSVNLHSDRRGKKLEEYDYIIDYNTVTSHRDDEREYLIHAWGY